MSLKALGLSCKPFNQNTYHIILKPDEPVTYLAGQYLKIHLNDTWCSYSIANAPNKDNTLELHLRHHDNNPYTSDLLKKLKNHTPLDIKLPFGHCHIDAFSNNDPILFIAGGTGVAPIHAMMEALRAKKTPPNMHLIWASRNTSGHYLDDIQYEAITTDQNKEVFIDAILKHQDHQGPIIIAGPFDMANTIKDALLKAGFSDKKLFSDAF